MEMRVARRRSQASRPHDQRWKLDCSRDWVQSRGDAFRNRCPVSPPGIARCSRGPDAWPVRRRLNNPEARPSGDWRKSARHESNLNTAVWEAGLPSAGRASMPASAKREAMQQCRECLGLRHRDRDGGRRNPNLQPKRDQFRTALRLLLHSANDMNLNRCQTRTAFSPSAKKRAEPQSRRSLRPLNSGAWMNTSGSRGRRRSNPASNGARPITPTSTTRSFGLGSPDFASRARSVRRVSENSSRAEFSRYSLEQILHRHPALAFQFHHVRRDPLENGEMTSLKPAPVVESSRHVRSRTPPSENSRSRGSCHSGDSQIFPSNPSGARLDSERPRQPPHRGPATFDPDVNNASSNALGVTIRGGIIARPTCWASAARSARRRRPCGPPAHDNEPVG